MSIGHATLFLWLNTFVLELRLSPRLEGGANLECQCHKRFVTEVTSHRQHRSTPSRRAACCRKVGNAQCARGFFSLSAALLVSLLQHNALLSDCSGDTRSSGSRDFSIIAHCAGQRPISCTRRHGQFTRLSHTTQRSVKIICAPYRICVSEMVAQESAHMPPLYL